LDLEKIDSGRDVEGDVVLLLGVLSAISYGFRVWGLG
jgi:hypothetical protein